MLRRGLILPNSATDHRQDKCNWYKKRAEIIRFLLFVPPQGLEPWTPTLRVSCSTNWAKEAFLRSVLPDCECKDKAKFLFRQTFCKKNVLFTLLCRNFLGNNVMITPWTGKSRARTPIKTISVDFCWFRCWSTFLLYICNDGNPKRHNFCFYPLR